MNQNNLPAQPQDHLKDPRTGLTLPLRQSLGSQELARHRAMVALELEVIAKKFDRFGWDRDRDSAAQDRNITDWIDALQEYPLDEVQAACKAATLANPNRMPNEGHVIREIVKARQAWIARNPPKPEPEPDRRPVSKERAAQIMQEAGFAPKRFG